nr:MAG TPA: hypothetical protein [Caudoviricetes sp.]
MYKLRANQIEELYSAYARNDRKIATVLMTEYDIGQKIINLCALEKENYNNLTVTNGNGVTKAVICLDLSKVLRDMSIVKLEEFLGRVGYNGKIKLLKNTELGGFVSIYYFDYVEPQICNTLLFTHGNCADGFVSGLIVSDKYNIPLENTIECLHTENFQEIAKRVSLEDRLKNGDITKIIFTDYFIKEDDFEYFIDLIRDYKFDLIVVDHHVTNQALCNRLVDAIDLMDIKQSRLTDVTGLTDAKEGRVFDICFNNRYSGALLCYFKFVLGLSNSEINEETLIQPLLKQVPDFIRYIHENDTWTFTDEYSKPFGVAFNALFRSKRPVESDTLDEDGRTMFSVKNYIKAINHAFPKSEQCSETAFGQRLVKEIVNYGKRVLEIRYNYINTIKQTATIHEVTIDGEVYQVGLVNANTVFTSDIANQLVVDHGLDAAISWCTDKNKVVVSVRSVDFDTTLITKHFNGGGHKLASGCSFKSLEEFTTKLYNHLHGGTLVINTK